MELHPAYKFNFTPHTNGSVVVRSLYHNSLEICHRNPGLQQAGASGVTLIPATYLKACQSEADRFNGFFVLHGPEKWIDGPVLLYSIYPMHAAPYFRHSRGRFSVMQFPGGVRPYPLPTSGWRYTGADVQPSREPSSHPRPYRLGKAIQASHHPRYSAQSRRIDPAIANLLPNWNRSSQSRESHSTPPPLTAHDTPRLLDVEAGLKAIESNKQLENLKAVLGIRPRPTRPRCSSRNSSVRITVDGPDRRDIDEPPDALHNIRRESLQEGPINTIRLLTEGFIGHSDHSGRRSTRGRCRHSRELAFGSFDFSASTRGRPRQQLYSEHRPRASQSLGQDPSPGLGQGVGSTSADQSRV